MDLKLNNKTALVTGSTAGIGLAIATSLATEGARVIINGRSQERVNQALAEIRNKSGSDKISGVAADLATAEGVAAMTKAVPAVDVLVNNVGIFKVQPFEEIPDSEWLRFFETNVLSGVRLSRFYLPGMKRKNWGRILFISSESALNIPVEMIHYGMTKTAQLSVARGLAELTAGTGVTVNSVLPGPTESEGVATMLEDAIKQKGSRAAAEKDFFEHARPTSLLKRFATTEEVAAMVTYLAGEPSSATNGAALRVDGGVVKLVM